MRGRFTSIVAVSWLGVCASASAQERAPVAEIVRLDIAVTDAQGRPVPGLLREDFDVREDGKPQAVTEFVFLGATSPRPAPPAATGAQSPELAAEPGRLISIVVDDLHVSRAGAVSVRDVLRRFVDKLAEPQDRIALVTTGSRRGILQPTSDRAVLGEAIDRIQGRADSINTGRGAQVTAEQAEQILRGDPAALQLAARLLRDDPGRGTSNGGTPRDSIRTSDPDRAVLEPDLRGTAQQSEEQARAILAEALSFSAISLETIEGMLRGLAPLPGRKLCLLVSEGFLVGKGTPEEQTRQLQQVADAATRSGTAVHVLLASDMGQAASGVEMPGALGPAGLRERVARAGEKITSETLRGLADDTGGLLIHGADATDAGLIRMLNDVDATYLLGYEPLNQKADGRFRKISVRLPRHKDYVVRTRRGYYAAGGKKPVKEPQRAARAPLGRAEAELALSAPPQAGEVPLLLAADYAELASGGAHAIVKARLDAAKLPWKKADKRQRAEFDLIGAVCDASGRVGPLFAGQHYAFDLTPAERDKLTADGVRFAANVPLKPGRHEIRMVALDPDRTPLGGASRSIEVPDLAEKKLTLSGVFLSSVASAAGGAWSAPRDAQVLRHFAKDDILSFQVYVYNPARDGAGASDLVLQVQVLQAGKPLFASKARPVLLQEKDGALLPESDGIPLSGLAPGGYELRILVADRRTNEVASRGVDFTVD